MILLGAVLLLNLAWLVLQVVTALVMELPLQAVQLGLGPSWPVTSRLRVGLIPGAFVKFDPEILATLSFARFSLLILMPWAALGALAVIGGGAGVDDFVRGLTLLARVRDVFTHWGAWNELLQLTPLATFARLAARIVSLNLLPLSALAGGQLLMRLMTERARIVFSIGSLLLIVAAVIYGLVSSSQ